MAERPGYVYVASSWRNALQPTVVAALRSSGIGCYDFRNPGPGDTGFSWREVRPANTTCPRCGSDNPAVRREGRHLDYGPMLCPDQWHGIPGKGSDWEPVDRFIEMVNHPRAIDGFISDFTAVKAADAFVMVLPCGKSAHLELGWAVGAGKRTAILLEDPVEPELMYRMVDHLATSLDDLLAWIGADQ